MKTPHLPAGGWSYTAPPSLTAVQKYWLFRPGALTAGLRQLGAMRLRVLAEYAEGARPDEALALHLAPGAAVWVREVLMSVDDVDSVVARSITPLAASRAMWQGMRRLRTRPLADMLYHDSSVRRSRFVCRRLAAPVPFHRTAAGVAGGSGAGSDARSGVMSAGSGAAAASHAITPLVLARRSVFWRMGQPLLVAEGFLPEFWQHARILHDSRLPLRGK
ncbi:MULTISPECIES: chorismate lyase [unclassified Achromobacter]|uniref:chorismate--pyruvate lyase family protein n=1 Tax=unclassified Achromobacter TaxID=2626865 RepID=UPI000B51CDD4|nr:MULTISPECIES: chorismate lyase [unclassified Achromobacter]OWT80613.1 chorismate--pyruvate lyase [Achromobacter sp. HZ34]OWT82496.1 chorismate--pyruvate lyase [Achromobacter sp. HZ28]